MRFCVSRCLDVFDVATLEIFDMVGVQDILTAYSEFETVNRQIIQDSLWNITVISVCQNTNTQMDFGQLGTLIYIRIRKPLVVA